MICNSTVYTFNERGVSGGTHHIGDPDCAKFLIEPVHNLLLQENKRTMLTDPWCHELSEDAY